MIHIHNLNMVFHIIVYDPGNWTASKMVCTGGISTIPETKMKELDKQKREYLQR